MEKSLIYCDKKLSNTGTCSNLAVLSCTAVFNNNNQKKHYRCSEHKLTGTAHSKIDVNSLEQFNQKDKLTEVNNYLIQFI